MAWVHVKIGADRFNCPASFIEDYLEGVTELDLADTEYWIFWSPTSGDTPKKHLAKQKKIIHVTDAVRQKSKGKVVPGYYKGVVLMVKDSESDLDAALDTKRLRIPTGSSKSKRKASHSGKGKSAKCSNNDQPKLKRMKKSANKTNMLVDNEDDTLASPLMDAETIDNELMDIDTLKSCREMESSNNHEADAIMKKIAASRNAALEPKPPASQKVDGKHEDLGSGPVPELNTETAVSDDGLDHSPSTLPKCLNEKTSPSSVDIVRSESSAGSGSSSKVFPQDPSASAGESPSLQMFNIPEKKSRDLKEKVMCVNSSSNESTSSDESLFNGGSDDDDSVPPEVFNDLKQKFVESKAKIKAIKEKNRKMKEELIKQSRNLGSVQKNLQTVEETQRKGQRVSKSPHSESTESKNVGNQVSDSKGSTSGDSLKISPRHSDKNKNNGSKEKASGMQKRRELLLNKKKARETSKKGAKRKLTFSQADWENEEWILTEPQKKSLFKSVKAGANNDGNFCKKGIDLMWEREELLERSAKGVGAPKPGEVARPECTPLKKAYLEDLLKTRVESEGGSKEEVNERANMDVLEKHLSSKICTVRIAAAKGAAVEENDA